MRQAYSILPAERASDYAPLTLDGQPILSMSFLPLSPTNSVHASAGWRAVPSVRYRADIDGLRALAVIPVVLFHFRFSAFSGGYVGVDVFFVISGYLISLLICTEIERKQFSIVSFYERRVRRIFPALFLVMIVTTVLAMLILMPRDLTLFGRSLLAATTFVSNMEFWGETGYFGIGPDREPLLHTWSLAVEEQFYVVFPPLLIATSRFLKGRYLAVIVPLLIVSLLLSVWGVRHYPSAAFFLLPPRFWELLLGALIAQPALQMPLRPGAANALCAIGLVMIACSIAAFSPDTPFPGIAAVLPCGGAALVVYSGVRRTADEAGRFVSAILSVAPIVFIGRISYSLYLWHWPLFVFARYQLGRDLNWPETIAAVAVAVGLSTISWRYVEQPFRGQRGALTRPRLFGVSAAVMMVSAGLGFIAVATAGLPARYGPSVRQLLIVAQEADNSSSRCGARNSTSNRLCRLGSATAGRPTFILWGDSHAAAISPAVDAAAAGYGEAGWLAWHSACPPLLGVRRMDAAKDCDRYNNGVLDFIRRNDIRTVILHARWAIIAEGTRYKGEDGRAPIIADATADGGSMASNKEIFARSLTKTVETLKAEGRRVVIVASVPEVGVRVPESLARARMNGLSEDIGPSRSDYENRQKFVLTLLQQLHANYGVEIVYPEQYLCREARCTVLKDGHPLYVDSHHLSLAGAASLEPLFVQVLAPRAKSQLHNLPDRLAHHAEEPIRGTPAVQ